MKEQFFSKKRAYTIWTLICTVSVVVAFQNCSGKVGFIADSSSTSQSSTADSTASGSQNLSTESDNSTGMVSSMAHVEGQLYGHCTMQLDGNFNVMHNGAIDKNGVKLANVPAGVGGATWPVTVCPNSGSGSAVKCADGFKVVAHEVSQMDCSVSEGATMCKTYWATYNCSKISNSRTTASSSGSGTSSSVTTPAETLKWVYTNPTACVGPTPAPAAIGSACSPAGTTASNSCGTATCQLAK